MNKSISEYIVTINDNLKIVINNTNKTSFTDAFKKISSSINGLNKRISNTKFNKNEIQDIKNNLQLLEKEANNIALLSNNFPKSKNDIKDEYNKHFKPTYYKIKDIIKAAQEPDEPQKEKRNIQPRPSKKSNEPDEPDFF